MFKYLWFIILLLYFFIGGYFALKDIKEMEDFEGCHTHTKIYFITFFAVIAFVVLGSFGNFCASLR